ncbi:uncharacterized protein CIMG_13394 [Coccidioides immitis RS]|uniref:Uncharacterized protein n=1 Tax=Coccidioides immitis (strain RS) TaxID=246410 RepID=J3KED4_COCIM|nr:uncharacterized protein CIMG_13394 [Coccidioides immitis RS]EAS33831.3 hypothetical protein CIMG_13394 [Coccidioides immitis RS]
MIMYTSGVTQSKTDKRENKRFALSESSGRFEVFFFESGCSWCAVLVDCSVKTTAPIYVRSPAYAIGAGLRRRNEYKSTFIHHHHHHHTIVTDSSV